MKTSEEFKEALKEKKVPVLVLDQKWHRLFAIHGKTDEIKEKEAELNSLLAEQGKINTELKNLRKLKTKLMDEIVQNMDDNPANGNSDRDKNLEKDKKFIDEINEKIDMNNDKMLDIPEQIKNVNEELMILSMDYFYEKIRVNQTEAKEIEDWITQVRIDLKKNIIRKQNRDINNREIYSYLHDIFGAEVLNLFDIQYDDPMIDKKES